LHLRPLDARVATPRIRPVESYSGTQGNILAGPFKHFHGAPVGQIFKKFFLKMVHSGVLYISGRRRGPQTSRARCSLLPTHPLDGSATYVVQWLWL